MSIKESQARFLAR